MQLHLSSWPEIETYLESSKAVLIPIGSTGEPQALRQPCELASWAMLA